MPQVTLTVNGKQHTVEVEGRTLLVELLREKLGLTGTHVGCDTSQCGACVVHIDGMSVKSCTQLALQADGTSITTIEGLAAADGTLHPMQEMFREHHALQCGFCTPGMVMTAVDLVQSHPRRADREGNPRRPGRQSLPLHRLPQHRQGDRRRSSVDARRSGRIKRRAARREIRPWASRASAHPYAARKTCASSAAGATTPTTSTVPASFTPISSGPTGRMRGSTAIDTAAAAKAARRGAGVHRRRHRGRRTSAAFPAAGRSTTRTARRWPSRCIRCSPSARCAMSATRSPW